MHPTVGGPGAVLEAARAVLAAEAARQDGGALAATGGTPTRGVSHQPGVSLVNRQADNRELMSVLLYTVFTITP